jgi:decaprenylphospho-beta-D-erythro-pentofuranosid-2-ulose 2-reductase
MKKILVVGATSAIAEACLRQWAVEPCLFFLVARNSEKIERVASDLRAKGSVAHCFVGDMSEVDRHHEMLSACLDEISAVDIALIAYGTLPDQAQCTSNTALGVREFVVNGLSVMALMNQLSGLMIEQGNGCIAVISSVAGDRGRPSNYWYGAAKGAVSTFSSGLRASLRSKGVHVLTIKPGFVDTPMTEGLDLPRRLVVSAEKVAKDICAAVASRKDTLYTPWFWRYIMLVIIHIPSVIFKRLKL